MIGTEDAFSPNLFAHDLTPGCPRLSPKASPIAQNAPGNPPGAFLFLNHSIRSRCGRSPLVFRDGDCLASTPPGDLGTSIKGGPTAPCVTGTAGLAPLTNGSGIRPSGRGKGTPRQSERKATVVPSHKERPHPAPSRQPAPPQCSDSPVVHEAASDRRHPACCSGIHEGNPLFSCYTARIPSVGSGKAPQMSSSSEGTPLRDQPRPHSFPP
jgi:hypothetical protein